MTACNDQRSDIPRVSPVSGQYRSILRLSVSCFVFLTLVLGLLYPGLVTLAAQCWDSQQAQGSVMQVGQVQASRLIGQDFHSDRFFQGRASAVNYDAALSGGMNLSMSHETQKRLIQERVAYWRAKTGSNAPVPADLVTASASGLDPHISVQAARYQAQTVAVANHLAQTQVEQLIEQSVVDGWFLFSSEAIVNVVELNARVLELVQQHKTR